MNDWAIVRKTHSYQEFQMESENWEIINPKATYNKSGQARSLLSKDSFDRMGVSAYPDLICHKYILQYYQSHFIYADQTCFLY